MWSLQDRVLALRNCAYLMIASGNIFSDVDGEHLSKTYGVSYQPRKLEKLWNEQLERFRKEQLTKLVPNTDDIVEGK